ncbi:hypothetical protein HDU97_004267 [Phlyctochytrium planicorne]|nr:hypothetical protein HDU97_004267 [Phlyctochytrium planicorne]
MNGSIPEALANTISLRELDLAGNQLSGSIPSWISTLSNLESIDLSFNQLSGEIPHSICELKSLKHFSASSNNLYGELPAFLDGVPTSSIDVQDNFMSGKIPDVDIGIKLKVNSNCYSNEDLEPVLRQFVSQGNQVNVTQRSGSECSAYLAQIKGASVTQALTPTNVAPSVPNGGSSSGSTLSLVLGLCIAGFVVVIAIALVLSRRYRQRTKLSDFEVTVDQEPNIELTEIAGGGDQGSIKEKSDTSTMFKQTNPGESKDGELFRNLEPYSADGSTTAGTSSGFAMPGTKVEQPPPPATSGNSDSRNYSQESYDISNWNPAQVATALTSAGVNLDFIEIMKDRAVDGNHLVQLDHERLEAMGIGPFDARVLLLIAIGMLKESNDVDRPPEYA